MSAKTFLVRANRLYLPIALGITTISTAYTGLYTGRLADEEKRTQAQEELLVEQQKAKEQLIVDQQKELHEKSDELRADRQVITKLDLDLYDRVKDAVTRDHVNHAEVMALTTLITNLADGDVKTGLAQIVYGASNDPAIRVAAASAAYESENHTVAPTAPASPSRWSNWNIDIFWCESSGEHARLAATKALGLNDDGGTGRWRVRMLPITRNADPGYSVTGIQVRAEAESVDPQESKLGIELRKELQDLTGKTVSVFEPNNRTPRYISVFFCN